MKYAFPFLFLLATPSLAAEPTPQPKPPATVSVEFTAQDLQIVYFALKESGAACDANIKDYCQIVPLRETLMAKIGMAGQQLATKK